jgi:hypothetical protein
MRDSAVTECVGQSQNESESAFRLARQRRAEPIALWRHQDERAEASKDTVFL